MDAASVRKLFCVSKDPLGKVGKALLEGYKDDARAFAQSTMFRGDVTLVEPAKRCRKRIGGGRCRRSVSDGAIIQVCTKHSRSETSDANLDGFRVFLRGLSAYNREARRLGAWEVPVDRFYS